MYLIQVYFAKAETGRSMELFADIAIL